MDWSRKIQTLFTCLLTLQFVVVALHDLVDIPGWTHGTQVQSVVGRRKLWLGTLVNALFPGLAVAFAIDACITPSLYSGDDWVFGCLIGKSTWNRVSPGFDATRMSPWCLRAMRHAVSSPRPVPCPTPLVVKKGSKIRA
jgi:hypothetical protein